MRKLFLGVIALLLVGCGTHPNQLKDPYCKQWVLERNFEPGGAAVKAVCVLRIIPPGKTWEEK